MLSVVDQLSGIPPNPTQSNPIQSDSIQCVSGGDQSEHSRAMKARALQRVVDLIHQNKYQAAVAEVPFVDCGRAVSGSSGGQKQMLVF